MTQVQITVRVFLCGGGLHVLLVLVAASVCPHCDKLEAGPVCVHILSPSDSWDGLQLHLG